MDRPQSSFSFKIMAAMFKVRDIVKPRGSVLEEVGIRPGFRVLDFGCGPGGYVLPLSRLVGISGKVYALDINPMAIKSVKSLVARYRLANVETIISDGPTGLKDGSMDVVILYDVLHALKKPDEVLKELHRVLKPGETLSVSDHHLTKEDIASRVTGTRLFQMAFKGQTLNFTSM